MTNDKKTTAARTYRAAMERARYLTDRARTRARIARELAARPSPFRTR